MKKVLVVLATIISILVVLPVYAGVNDFYFSDFTGDYYLSRDEEGVSHLKVIESVTAEFPEYKQNKGICRQIAYTNQGGTNVTLPNLTQSNIKVTRNGISEPIYSIEKGNGFYDVCTGTDEYVLGTQVYTFEYEFAKVVTEFNEGGREYQELYWDTNGNGATQRFEKVTARLHFADKSVWTGESWCYVGKYGEKGSERCVTEPLGDGVEFSARNLLGYENLTFDAELKPGSFVVPEPEKNFTYVWLTVGLGAICLVCIALSVRKFMKTRDKAKYYKGIFVKPEYQPHADYDLVEMAEIYIGKKKDVKVAMLLELVVKRKIEFQKADKKKWNILVKSLEGVREEYIDLLAILNGGDRPKMDDVIELKSRTATSRLIALKKTMDDILKENLERSGLVLDKYRIGSSGGGTGLTNAIIVAFVVACLGFFVIGFLNDAVTEMNSSYGGNMVMDSKQFFIVTLVMMAVTAGVCEILSSLSQRYAKHTLKGLEMSRYMDGLKLYIEMAEAERMKMLQSVEGVDTSPEGIVKLYEKLLPYAAVFGLEESWMDEMKEYCKVKEVVEPDYLLMGLTVSQFSRTMRSVAGYATTATVMASSGGGSSSGFSGGGGGGFSGGGGGGGGFGGR